MIKLFHPARRQRLTAARRRALLSGTRLAGAVVLAALVTGVAIPAWADGGTGGQGGTGNPGGTGAPGFNGMPGGSALGGGSFGGGGGGGAGGGAGGSGGNGPPGGGGGLGGTSGSSNGQAGGVGGSGLGGGGGGGGGGFNGNGSGTPTINNSSSLSGGTGGAGGGGSSSSGGGGGGGAGGFGAVVTGSGASSNSSSIGGGAGGSGGGGNGGNNFGGNGGDGGVGVQFTMSASGARLTNSNMVSGGDGGAGGTATAGATGGTGGLGGAGIAGTGITVINSGTIAGGAGGIGGAITGGPSTPGTPGAGGAGITGSGLTIMNSGTIAGGISGAGAQANAITFTSGTNILTLQSGSKLIGNIEIDGGGGLIFNQSTDQTLSNVIAGNGSIFKDFAGTLTLSGANTYSGATFVDGGTLEVDGSIAHSSTVFVNSGGTLAGTGTVSNAVVNAGGTLAPGNAANPTGTLAITGNLMFLSGAIYLVQVNSTTASSANVSGQATLTGAKVNVQFVPGSSVAKRDDILILRASGGFSGTTFSGVSTPGFTETLNYSGTDVTLNITGATLGAGAGLNANQQNVANTLNNFFNNGGALPANFAGIFGLTGGNLANALTQASGETATGSQQTTFDAMSQFMGVMTDPFMNRGGGNGSSSPLGYAAASNPTDAFAMFTKAPPAAPFEQRWSVWAAGFGGSQSTSGNAVVGSNNTTSSIAGTAVGADYLISPNTIAGFALAGGGTSFSVAGGGTGRSDLFQAGAYVRHNAGPAYISAALAYGWQDITTNRTVTAAGIDHLRAEFNANAWSGRLEGGYRFVPPATLGIGITPYAAAQFVTFDLPGYAEQAIVGTNNFALSSGAKDATDVRTELGIRTDKSFVVPDGILTLRGRFAWAHDYDPDRSIAATFQSLPGASFVVNGAAQAADSALTTASIEMKWKNNWSVAATFEGEFSNVTNSYAGKGVVRYQW
jgi:uncharacterized protein with beta-barrel porin domain